MNVCLRWTVVALWIATAWPAGAALDDCDVNGDGVVNVSDVQWEVSEVLSPTACVHDLKLDGRRGMWPASWLYPKRPGHADGSEIDHPEFFIMKNQNSFDWTGYNHGPGAAADFIPS